MFVAEQKKKENIAEYVLYLWQIEDLIRANKLDIKLIETNLIKSFNLPAAEFQKMSAWYSDMIQQMKDEKITERGHLSFLNDVINSLNEIHEKLIASEDAAYMELYEKAKPNIKILKTKGNRNINDINVCFNGLYGILLLKIQNKKISNATDKARKTISNLVAFLAKEYNNS